VPYAEGCQSSTYLSIPVVCCNDHGYDVEKSMGSMFYRYSGAVELFCLHICRSGEAIVVGLGQCDDMTNLRVFFPSALPLF
jgi:hypothetical protein